MKQWNRLIVACIASGSFAVAAANDLTVISFGKMNENLQTKAYFQPFEKATGVKLTAYSYDGQMDEIKEMVGSGKTSWDLVEVEAPELLRGCKSGLFEKLDYSNMTLEEKMATMNEMLSLTQPRALPKPSEKAQDQGQYVEGQFTEIPREAAE